MFFFFASLLLVFFFFFFFSSRRRHTRCGRDWSSDVCSSDLVSTWFRYGCTINCTRYHWRLCLTESRRMDGTDQNILWRYFISRSHLVEIGRACVGKECRSRWSTYH